MSTTALAWLLLAAIVALIVWAWAHDRRTRWRPRLAHQVAVRAEDADEDDDDDGGRDYTLEVVGESYYQDALREIVEASGDPGPNYPFAGAHCEVLARLVPENDNPHDPMAVRVEIEGRKIGHLSRDDARAYRRSRGEVSTPAWALITGGWERRATEQYERSTGSFGVQLDLRLVVLLTALLALAGCVTSREELRQTPPARTASVRAPSYHILAACALDDMERHGGGTSAQFRLLDRADLRTATVTGVVMEGSVPSWMLEATFRQRDSVVDVETRKAAGIAGRLASKIEGLAWDAITRCAGGETPSIERRAP